MKQDFTYFLMEKHAEDYTGTKDCMVDDCADWIANLDADDFLEYGDLFAKEQNKDLDYSKAICHCNYDKDCCPGIFTQIKKGEVVCNECGMSLRDLVETLEKQSKELLELLKQIDKHGSGLLGDKIKQAIAKAV